MMHRYLSVAVALVTTAAAAAQDEPEAAETPSFTRPSYSFLRQNEDWSVLAGVPKEARTDFWDAIKYVPLSEDGKIWASFGGSMQARLEAWWNFDFLPPAQGDDVFLLWRLLAHADIHFGEGFRVFVEGKSALSTDRSLPGGHRTLDVDTLDLQQLFLDVRVPFGQEADSGAFTVRPGRQMYQFGRQRLVSPLPWANTLRTWDGVTGIVEIENWKVTGWFSQFVPVRKYEFNEPDHNQLFYGVYAEGKVPDAGVGVNAYFLGLNRKNPQTFNGTTGPEERYTLGASARGVVPSTTFDYDFEAAYQFGRVDGSDVAAWMMGARFGWTFADTWSTPRVFGGLELGSGDDQAGGAVQTFNQLFPLGHAYFGYIDLVGRQNAIGPLLGASFKPLPKMTVELAGHLFYRYSTQDALYNAGGGVVRAGNLGDSSEIGQEIDLTVTYQFDRHTHVLFGYSHFFPGTFVQQSGPANDVDFLYLQLTYTF